MAAGATNDRADRAAFHFGSWVLERFFELLWRDPARRDHPLALRVVVKFGRAFRADEDHRGLWVRHLAHVFRGEDRWRLRRIARRAGPLRGGDAHCLTG